MSDEPTTNSGAWWAKLKDEDLQRELGRSSPGQDSYVGARDEIQRRAAVKRERLMRWALGLAALSLLASLAIAIGLISVRQQLAALREAEYPTLAEGSEQPGEALAGGSARSDGLSTSTGASAQTPNGVEVSNAPNDGAQLAPGAATKGASSRKASGAQRGAAKGASSGGADTSVPSGGAGGARSDGPEGGVPRQRARGNAAPGRGQDVTPMERGDRAHGSAPSLLRAPRVAACQRSCPRSAKAGPTLVGQVAASA